VGTGNKIAHKITQKIAQQHDLEYKLVLDRNTNLSSGVYHTSIYDITPAELQTLLYGKSCKIILLDQDQESYNNAEDFAITISMIFDLQKSFVVEYQNPDLVPWILKELHTNPAFCIVPFVGLYQTQKQKSHCCHMQSRPSDKFDASWSQSVKQSMLQGKRVDECSHCWQKEDLGMTSQRQNFTQTWSSKFNIKTQQDVTTVPSPLYVYAVLDNRCNAMCRMCVPGNSHLIAREYRAIGLSNYTNHKKQGIFDHVDIDHVRCLQIAGGEPTINKEFFQFLDQCIEKQRNDIAFEVSTNASVLSTQMLDYCNKFPNLEFSVSVDGFDQLNRYIRWPIKWDNWCRNVATLYDMGRVANFNTVISIYNIAHLFDLYNFLDDKYLKVHCSMNLVAGVEPDQSPWNHPEPQTILDNLQLIKQLKRYQQDQYFKTTIDKIEIQVKNSLPDTESLKKFFEFNRVLDNSRGVKLKDFVPELEKHDQ